MRLRVWEKVTDNCRRLAQMHQFQPEPFQLALACLGNGGLKAQAAWQNVQIQKFLHRELRIYDDAVKGRKLQYSSKFRRYAPIVKTGLSRALGDFDDDDEEDLESGAPKEIRQASVAGNIDDDDEEEEGVGGNATVDDEEQARLPTVPSAAHNALYGMYMLDGRSWQSALCEF
jgi:general transcription factor 3C polypeptide 3 (transcription factor C subunit 4)